MPLEVDPVCTACNINRGPAEDVVDIARRMLGLDKSDPDPVPVANVDLPLQEKIDKEERNLIESALRANRYNRVERLQIK
jgi:hypothetical protein